DGDDAGVKERKDLQQYFGQKKVQFRANEEFVSVRDRFAIEGLFPDAWLISLYSSRPGWFETFSVDASGSLEPFKVKDDRKGDVIKALRAVADSQADLAWAERFISVLAA